MESTPKYVIDTCSFTALRRVYPHDVFPGAWQAISQMAEDAIIISSIEVYIELQEQEDIVTEWANNHRNIFLLLKNEIQLKASEILDQFPNLLDLNNMKSNADPFVIATAFLYDCTVVTEEDPTGNGAKLVKIPNVCNFLGIKVYKTS